MENYTDFNDVQQSDLKLTDLGQNTHFCDIDFLSLPNPDTLQDLNSFPTDTHQIIFNSTFSEGVSFSEQPVDQQDVTYNSHLNQYPSNNNWSDQGSIYRPKLQCLVPECSQDREFPSESALQKHKAKHSKPYICQVPNCKHPRFGDKGGLDRHNREVHGSQIYCCPITSCKRHVRGFPRKYNLFEHQKRCHPSQSPDLTPPSIPRPKNHTNDYMKGQQESHESGSSAEIVTRDGGRLREKLENLYNMRAEIKVDIEALERCLNLLGEDSP